MQSVKIMCAQCPRYRECSSATRLFVNYCGAGSKQMNERIKKAALECRLRKGYLFKKDFAIHRPAVPAPAAACARRAA
ncbi:MAG: hypothetical protein JW699_06105 [Chitinispirillaceae bacterium]|nr:hypothetical protein [Chitinispirillaceae bacterium]